MKTLDDVQANMSTLYEELKGGKIELKLAAELSNITGKWLKAEQLKVMRELMLTNLRAVALAQPKRPRLKRVS